MWLTKYRSKYLGDQKGVTLVFVAICMVMLLGFVALAVDIGYLMASKNEAQNIADGAALAATRELGDQHFNGMDPIDEVAIRTVARNVAGNNTIAGKSITITNDSDIEIGYWDPVDNVFNATASPTAVLNKKNAVRVTTKRNDADNGPIDTFFAKVLGIDLFSVSADAIAALTGASKVGPGELTPIGISKAWWDNKSDFCDQPIKFSPSNDPAGCAGWNTYKLNSNTNNLREVLDVNYISPSLGTGETVDFIGGNVATGLCSNNVNWATDNKADLWGLWDQNKDPITNDWKTGVVVYDAVDCENPSGDLTILGFSTIIIHGVECSPSQTINATVICDEFQYARGGGGLYGTYGNIPGLVE